MHLHVKGTKVNLKTLITLMRLFLHYEDCCYLFPSQLIYLDRHALDIIGPPILSLNITSN
jgi:hypothetical protein